MKKILLIIGTIVSLVIILIAWQFFSSGSSPSSSTSAPEETTGLVDRLHGHIIINHNPLSIDQQGRLFDISLPQLQTNTLLSDLGNGLRIYAISGPDNLNRIAFIKGNFVKERHELWFIDLNGQNEKMVFEGPGVGMWDNYIGTYIGLSHQEGLVAFISQLQKIALKGEEIVLQQGTLSIWDLDTYQVSDIKLHAMDSTFSWSPDDKTLYYVDLVEPEEGIALLERYQDTNPQFGESYRQWTKVPVVHTVELASRRIHKLHVGAQPILSPSGIWLALQDIDLNVQLFNTHNQKTEKLMIPDLTAPGIIAFVDDHHILYWAKPMMHSTSTAYAPPPQPAVKVINWQSGELQTVLPAVETAWTISFGQGRK